MSLAPIPAERFGGLNLADDPYEIGWGGAIDCLNVDFDRHGRIRQRDGYTTFTTVAAANGYQALFSGVGAPSLLAGRSGAVDALNSGGAVLATVTSGLVNPSWSFANFGTTGTTSYSYAQTSTITTKRWDGTVWTAPAGMPAPRYIATWSAQARMVAAGGLIGAYGPGGAASSGDHVWFSDPGTAEAWTANNFVRLSPNDGETIFAAVAWNDSLYIFKQTKVYVFYGVSTDSTGNPIFNYRTLALPARISGANVGNVVATPRGIFYSSERGIYLYDGGGFRLLTAPLDPIWLGGASSYYLGTLRQFPDESASLWFADERLYVSISHGGSNYQTLVWDARLDTWTLWDAPSFCATSLTYGGTSKYLAFASTAANHVAVFNFVTPATTDNGANISSHYRFGFSDLGQPDKRRKAIRQWQLRGSGTVNFAVAADSATTIPTTAGGAKGQVTLGDPGFYRIAQRGRDFSPYIESVSGGAWTLSGLTAQVSG